MLSMKSVLLMSLVLLAGPLQADAPATRLTVDNTLLRIHMTARTPQQMQAFYEARGFPRAMIEKIAATCFITTTVRNKGKKVLWLDLAKWQFRQGDQPLTRLDRVHWQQLWQKMQAPMASQSTFRWTLLPEKLDFRPDEGEGGNIILPRVAGPIQIRAHFIQGRDPAKGRVINIDLPPIHCAEDAE